MNYNPMKNRIMRISVLLFAFLALNCISCSVNDKIEIARKNKELLKHVYTEVFVNWNRESVEEVLDLDFRSHDWPEDSRTGVEGFYDFYGPVLKSFPDTRYKVNDLIAQGDKVVVYWTLMGTQKGEFMGMPPTDTEISMDGIAIYRVENNKLKERWVVYDLFSLVEQVKRGQK